jgi:hypothetical protein
MNDPQPEGHVVSHIGRRKFLATLGGAAAAWPLAARAQQGESVRKIGVFLGITESDPDAQARAAAFREGLRELGWIEGRNLQIAFYWRQVLGDERARAADLMAFAPDVIVTNSPFVISLLQVRATPDCLRAGSRSGRRWLCREPGAARRQRHRVQQLRADDHQQMARPAQGGRARRHPNYRAGDVELGLLVPWHGSRQRALGTQLNVAQVKNADEIERSIEAAGRELNSGLIVLPARKRQSIETRLSP